ncbi:MAG: hypothetical protein KGL39_07990 [Patescibacteria group bacterium]|nr:hypothetical protein [Patescibacteria group bacterium]
MGVTFGGFRCIDPRQLWETARLQGLPYDNWIGKANSFRLPFGMDPGRGWLLMALQDLQRMDVNALHNLTFTNLETNEAVTHKNLVLVDWIAASAGYPDDPAQPCLVEIADRRRLYAGIPINKAYNLRASPGGAYYPGTLNSGNPWTWTQMVQDVWNTVGTLGTYSGLPYTPDGTPDGFVFWGMSAWDALSIVLGRLYCVLQLNPLTDKFGIVRLGDPDPPLTAAEKTWLPVKVWDDYATESAIGRAPALVRVFFRIQSVLPQPGASSFYGIDKPDTTGLGDSGAAAPGTYAILYDDEPAVYDGTGTLTNLSDLEARASERAANYYRALWLGTSKLHQVYGDVPPETGFVPASQLRETLWRDHMDGFKTEIIRGPYRLPQYTPPPVPSPTPTFADTTTAGISYCWLTIQSSAVFAADACGEALAEGYPAAAPNLGGWAGTVDACGEALAEGYPAAAPNLGVWAGTVDACGEALAEGYPAAAPNLGGWAGTVDACGEALAEGWPSDPIETSADATGDVTAEIWFAISYGSSGSSGCTVCDFAGLTGAACCDYLVPSDGNYDIWVDAYVLVTAAGGSFSVVITWTDEYGTVRNFVLQYNTDAGGDGTVVSSVGPYPFRLIQICAYPGTHVYTRTTLNGTQSLCNGAIAAPEPSPAGAGSFTGITYNFHASLEACRSSV